MGILGKRQDSDSNLSIEERTKRLQISEQEWHSSGDRAASNPSGRDANGAMGSVDAYQNQSGGFSEPATPSREEEEIAATELQKHIMQGGTMVEYQQMNSMLYALHQERIRRQQTNS